LESTPCVSKKNTCDLSHTRAIHQGKLNTAGLPKERDFLKSSNHEPEG